MGFRNREKEKKLLVGGNCSYEHVCAVLDSLLSDLEHTVHLGSSFDTYWRVRDPDMKGDFVRVRERDGIRQVTVKGKDRPSGNLDRIEVDIESTSSSRDIHRFLNCVLGRSVGVVRKIFKVWELESEYDTVCCYQVTEPELASIVIEVEAPSIARVVELEQMVKSAFPTNLITDAPGSLYEMLLQPRSKS